MEQFGLSKDSVEYYLYQKLSQGHNTQKVTKHALKFLDLSSSNPSDDVMSLSHAQDVESTYNAQQNSFTQTPTYSTITYPLDHQQKAIPQLAAYFEQSMLQNIPKTQIMGQFIQNGWHKPILEIAYMDAIQNHAKRANPGFTELQNVLSNLSQSQAGMLHKFDSNSVKAESGESKTVGSTNPQTQAKTFYAKDKAAFDEKLRHVVVPVAQEPAHVDDYLQSANSQNKDVTNSKRVNQFNIEEIEDRLRKQVIDQIESKVRQELARNNPSQYQQVQQQMQYQQQPPQYQSEQYPSQQFIQPVLQPIIQPIIQPVSQNIPSNISMQQSELPQNQNSSLAGAPNSQNEEELVKISSAQMEHMQTLSKSSSSYQKPAVDTSSQSENPQRVVENVNIKTSAVNVDGARVEDVSSEGGGMGLYNQVVAEAIHYTENATPDRLPTGVPELDRVISGGLKAYSTTLVSGGAGTGKSTLALQFLVNGIILNNQAGIYITFEQTAQSVRELGKQFGWDLENLEKQNMLIIHEYTPEQISKALETGGGSIRDMIDSISARRIVIDSITEFRMLFHSEIAQRKALTELFKSLGRWKCTSLVIGQEHSESGAHVSSVLDYECDAVILLYNERKGDIRFRSLEIYKMRETKHAGRIFPMRITQNGMIVNTEDRRLVRG
jgi:KaiC/GvpD/RAD55 family RecA-like ATPase